MCYFIEQFTRLAFDIENSFDFDISINRLYIYCIERSHTVYTRASNCRNSICHIDVYYEIQ